MFFTLALIGRPNVGKSTLFNRLTATRRAIVNHTPGVTRDRHEGWGKLFDLEFKIYDTGGLEKLDKSDLNSSIQEQTLLALKEADIGLFLIDGRKGLTSTDSHFSNWARATDTPIILIVNKCEGKAGQLGLLESYSLGFNQSIAISAEHGEGLRDLYEALKIKFTELGETRSEQQNFISSQQSILKTSRKVAIIGRPNVGKSTILNKLIGENRMIAGPESGITRDSIPITWEYRGQKIQLVDTAGLRKKARIKEQLESLSAGSTLNTIRFAEIAVLVLDATSILEKQDLSIARYIIEEGRALIIVINKWDLVKSRKKTLQNLTDRLETSLPQIRGVEYLTCSAIKNQGLRKIMPKLLQAYETWNSRITTSSLNRWLTQVTEIHPPPLINGRRLRLRYITQANSRPPTFIVYTSQLNKLPDSYSKYLTNRLRIDFKLPGTPIRIITRKSDNPFTHR